MSRQSDREPIKRKRDRDQAIAVCRLVLQYLPHLRFKPAELKMFPKSLVSEAAAAIADAELPPGYRQ
ncbi:MAG: nucleotidyltransferase domain-containing protein [Desulfosudis oleivorans]|nr:nucleotidyltransferase domain-containing protein [Desulfosudis oleivorans]